MPVSSSLFPNGDESGLGLHEIAGVCQIWSMKFTRQIRFQRSPPSPRYKTGKTSKNNTMTKSCSRPWCRSIVEIFTSTHNELLLSSRPSPNKLSARSPRYILSKQIFAFFHNGAAKDSKVGRIKKCYSLSVLSSHPFMKPGGSGFVDGRGSITKHIKSKDWNIFYFNIAHCSTP